MSYINQAKYQQFYLFQLATINSGTFNILFLRCMLATSSQLANILVVGQTELISNHDIKCVCSLHQMYQYMVLHHGTSLNGKLIHAYRLFLHCMDVGLKVGQMTWAPHLGLPTRSNQNPSFRISAYEPEDFQQITCSVEKRQMISE